jgi:hypothetical protein
MGRACTWIVAEKVLLSKAFIQASNDPIKGADQKCDVFKNTIIENFGRLADDAGYGADTQHFKGQCSAVFASLASLQCLTSSVGLPPPYSLLQPGRRQVAMIN